MLGPLIKHPDCGYGLERVIDCRDIRHWTDFGFSSVYCLLTKLERRCLIRVPEQPARTKSRQIYVATPDVHATALLTALVLIE